MTVYILQRRIQDYRIGIFERIAESLTDVVYLTERAPGQTVSFNWRLIERKHFLGFSRVVLPDLALHDLLITGLDLRNLSVWKQLLLAPDKVVIWGHGFGRSKLSILARPVRIAAAKLAGANLYYTDGGKAEFAPYVDESRLFVARNTISLPDYCPDGNAIKNSFLYFGDLRPEKGVDMLLDAFMVIASEQPEVSLSIVGDGTEKARLVDLVSRTGLSNRVHFFPRTECPEDLGKHLAGALATVSPLHVGLSVVQSFWAGVPVITQKNKRHAPEFEYCRDGENSLIFEGGVESLVVAMRSVLKEDRRAQLADNARGYYLKNLKEEYMINGFVGSVDCLRGLNDQNGS